MALDGVAITVTADSIVKTFGDKMEEGGGEHA